MNQRTNMSITAQNDYTCTVNNKIECTTFRWNLPNFLELEEFYQEVSSSTFVITNTSTSCELDFYITKDSSKEEYIYIDFRFSGDELVRKMKVILSIVNPIEQIFSKHLVVNKSEDFSFKLMSKKQLLSEEEFFHDGTLTFLCKIINVQEQESAVTGFLEHFQYFGNGIQRKVQAYYDEKLFCDVIFSIGDKLLHGHKLILAANSPVFEAMFKSDMSEQKERFVEIEGIDVSTFEAFLKYLYTGSIDKPSEICKDLLVVADKYLVQSLRDLCETSLAEKLDDTNAMEYLVLSHLHELTKLKRRTLEYIQSDQQKIIQSAEFKGVCKTYPELITQIFQKA